MTPTDRVDRAKWLLANARHAAMATVNDDGSPHNTPYLFMCGPNLKELYWGSNPKSRHSQNVERSGQLFVVMYEANAGGGLYIRARNGRQASGPELERALAAHNNVRAKLGKPPLPIDYYQAESEQRMYIADAVDFWVNYTERYDNGLIRRDRRHKITAQQLVD